MITGYLMPGCVGAGVLSPAARAGAAWRESREAAGATSRCAATRLGARRPSLALTVFPSHHSHPTDAGLLPCGRSGRSVSGRRWR